MSLLSGFSFTMSLVYIVAGIYMLFGKNIFNFTDFQRIGLGMLLFAYGTFRSYSSVKKIQEKEKEKENDS